MGKLLSASQPLQSKEFLKGRDSQLEGITKALYQRGRHVLIHGLRGVGKSSLAQTSAFLISEDCDPIIIGCDKNSSFSTVLREIFDEALNNNPAISAKVKESSAAIRIGAFTGQHKVSETEGRLGSDISVNDGARLIQCLCENLDASPVIVVDEFDQITSRSEQELFTNFIKQISDRHIEARFIFCGIGESTDAIMAAHASADRYFHSVELGQLAWEARFEIVNEAANQLGITIDRDTVIRIARISDGFPHYVHFIAEKLFWKVYEARNNGNVTPQLFAEAMNSAASSMDMKLRGPYEKATRKYRNDYEAVLWAVADGHELVRRSSDIFISYKKIMSSASETALDRRKFNQRINSLKKESHAAILTGSRQGWYEFSEKMIRGYVRLKAEQNGVELALDHPGYSSVHTDSRSNSEDT